MLGVCCQWLEPKSNTNSSLINILNEKHLQFGAFNSGKYNQDKILFTWMHNLNSLKFALESRIIPSGIRLFRISSNLFPLFDVADNSITLMSNIDILNKLKEIGDVCKLNNMRITTHPDQFVILNSNKNYVIEKSVNILNHHAWIFDMMGFERSAFYAINIHGGVKQNMSKLIYTINSLNDSVRKRLTLENDERSYSVPELYEVYKETNTPIVMDSHHYSFNDGNLNLEKSFEMAIASWGKVRPLTHLSNTEPGMENASFNKKRAHSSMAYYISDIQKELNNSSLIDIEMEFKNKNIAVFDAVEKLKLVI